MILNFKGKSAVVTGASGGMGLEISKTLSKNGISVLMIDIKAPEKSFLEKNQNCIFKKADVRNLKSLKSKIDLFYKKNKTHKKKKEKKKNGSGSQRWGGDNKQ